MSNKSFQLAIIGCGRWGKNHVKTAYNVFGTELKYVCDADLDKCRNLRRQFPDVKFITDIREIADDPNVNSVIIATPAESHFNLAKFMLKKGKNILVEKPLALFSHQAKELEQIAFGNDKILMVGHLLLYHPAIRKIKQLIQEGVLGKLQYIYSNRLNLGTVRKEENILWSFAPHDISVLQYLIEEDPIDVEAKGGVFLQPGIQDVTLTLLTYPHNIQAHIHVSWLHPVKEHRLVVIGDKSMIVFEDSKEVDKLILYPKGIDWINGEPKTRDEGFQVIEFDNEPPLEKELKHFKQCVVDNKQPLTDGSNGIRVLQILEKAQAKLAQKEAGSRNGKLPSGFVIRKNYFVHETAIVDEGCEIGEGTKIWHFSHIQSAAKIGKNCSLGQNVNVGNNVKIGNQVKIQNNVSVYEGVELEDYVFCGPSMVFTNILNPRCEFPQRGSEYYQHTLVKCGASLGANATIICGNNIGQFAFVGAGAVVTKDVPAHALVVGNPAKIVGWVCRCSAKLGFLENRATCGQCRREYIKSDEVVTCLNEMSFAADKGFKNPAPNMVHAEL